MTPARTPKPKPIPAAGGNPLTAGLEPTHPGEFLREVVLPAVSLPKEGIAQRLGISRGQLYKLIDLGSGVTPSMALRLAKFFGNSAEFWLTMQANYDLAKARRAMAEELAKIPTLDQTPRFDQFRA
jgi:addiction module HigA family antidote